MASATAFAAAALLALIAAPLPARADDTVRPPQAVEQAEHAVDNADQNPQENLQDSSHENTHEGPHERIRDIPHANAHGNAYGNIHGSVHGNVHGSVHGKAHGNARGGNSREAAHEIVRQPPHPVLHVCLNQKERRAAVEKGAVIHLATALHSIKNRMPGALIRARLCRGHLGHPPLVYVLTVLARDGKVARFYVDAVKGSVVGER